MKLVMTIRKNKYTVIIGILLLFRAMQYIPTYCSDYIGFQYLLSYKYGFISRGFVGSLLESIDFLSKGRLYFICLLVEISVTLLYLYFVHKVLKFLEGRKGVIVFVGICIFTLSPASIAYTYVINNFGRFDAILISIAILQSVILSYSSWKTGIAACVLSAIGIMIHPVFVFLYSPVAEVILLYKVFFTGEKEERKKWILFFILNTLIIIVMFSIFHFMAFISERYTLESLYNALQKRTDIDLTNCKVHLNDWYFSSAGELVNSAVRPFKSQMFTITFTMIFMFPYLYSLFTIWKKAMEVQKKSAGKLFCFIAGSALTIKYF